MVLSEKSAPSGQARGQTFRDHALEKIEILVLLPLGRLLTGLCPSIFEPLRKAAGLVALEPEEIVDEHRSELRAKERIPLECLQRGGQAVRQHWPIGAVRLLIRRSGISVIVDSVKAGDDLRHYIEVGICRGLA